MFLERVGEAICLKSMSKDPEERLNEDGLFPSEKKKSYTREKSEN